MKLQEMAQRLQVDPHTLQEWDRKGILQPSRTRTNRRNYTFDQYQTFAERRELIKTYKVELKPNAIMKQVLIDNANYRRYCWNQALSLWNDMYDMYQLNHADNIKPTGFRVKKILNGQKTDWQYQYSSRILQNAVLDLMKAFQNFFKHHDTGWGHPQFRSKRNPKQGFKTERAKLLPDRYLMLDRPRMAIVAKEDWAPIYFKGITQKQYQWLLDHAELTTVSVTIENGKFYASLPMKQQIKFKPAVHQKTAIDVNVGHLNYTDGQIKTLPYKLDRLYHRIKHYQWMLARKRQVNGKKANASHNYQVTKAKLQRDYRRVANIQHDIMHKFTTMLVSNYDQLVIEDLNVKEMQMSHVASKGLQRSMFGLFKQQMQYKCNWYGRRLVLANQFYPSTQRCSNCGHVKTGDEKITLAGNQKHHTKHNEYICYKCGFTCDRDQNAVLNLLHLLH